MADAVCLFCARQSLPGDNDCTLAARTPDGYGAPRRAEYKILCTLLRLLFLPRQYLQDRSNIRQMEIASKALRARLNLRCLRNKATDAFFSLHCRNTFQSRGVLKTS